MKPYRLNDPDNPGLAIFADLNPTITVTEKPAKTTTLARAAVTLPFYGMILGVLTIPLLLAFTGIVKTGLDTWENLPHDLQHVEPKQQSVMVTADGTEFARLFTENRELVTLEDVSDTFIDALLATEDARFYEHGALDLKGLIRAVARNATSDTEQGGSTLTQQLVENLRVMAATTEEELAAARPTTVRGKLQELRYAVELERTLDKDEILTQYVNSVYFGNGAYGVEAAAKRYFSTSATQLNAAQSATLIAMLKSPTAYDPLTRPDESLNRRNIVLDRMLATGTISSTDHAAARSTSLGLKPSLPESGCVASTYPVYCALVLSELSTNPAYGDTAEDRERFLATGGLRIHTALNDKAMKAANTAVAKALTTRNRVATGVAVIQPGTGRVLAVAQNRGYGQGRGETEIVYASAPAFQVGSTFKPIVTAAALEKGVSAKTTYTAPNNLTIRGLDAPKGGFRNSGGASYGRLDAYKATGKSVNTWFIRLVNEAGVKHTAEMARRLGMTSMPDTLTGKEASIALGAYETSPIQLANVYATFAARGQNCAPHAIVKMDRIDTGDNVPVADPNCHQAIMPVIADTVADTLLEPFKPGGTAPGLNLDRKAAGKTGTTNNNAATWFAGFTPQAATAVWVGDPRGGAKYPLKNITAYGRPHGTVYGSTVAGPIWRDTMTALHAGWPKRWLPKPGPVAGTLTSRSVPNLVGMSLPEAVTLLQAEGFDVVLAGNAKKTPALSQPGFVAAVTPEPGSNTGWGTTVTLTPTAGTPAYEVKK